VILVSPTEPEELRRLGKVSMMTEDRGADLLIWSASHQGWIGVQRKEMKDLIASVSDGRFAEQMMKLKGSVAMPVLLIEGKGSWTTDGKWAGGRSAMSWTGLSKMLFSTALLGVHLATTERLSGSCSTVEWTGSIEEWGRKPTHDSLSSTRGVVKVTWGTADNRDYQRHLLMGLPGVGPELADRILDAVGMPLTWRDGVVAEMESTVRGLGKKKLERMVAAVPATATPSTSTSGGA